MTKFNLFAACASLAVVLTAAVPTVASAHDYHWRHHHPRQAEVLQREHHQLRRINAERRHGEITGYQARDLRHNDRAIARQEHADARANGGYITHDQQRDLNARENAQSHAIGH